MQVINIMMVVPKRPTKRNETTEQLAKISVLEFGLGVRLVQIVQKHPNNTGKK